MTFEEIELARHFYYTGGIESFISAMETAAMMGRNVAKLVVNDFLNLNVEEDREEKAQVVIEEKVEL